MRRFVEWVVLRETVDIEAVASGLEFKPTSKKKLIYNFVQSDKNMPAIIAIDNNRLRSGLI